MPEMDGMSLLKKVKGINPRICVIVMIGYPTEESKAQAIELGAFGYLAKTHRCIRIGNCCERLSGVAMR
jgi:two-component system response regulator AtoC